MAKEPESHARQGNAGAGDAPRNHDLPHDEVDGHGFAVVHVHLFRQGTRRAPGRNWHHESDQAWSWRKVLEGKGTVGTGRGLGRLEAVVAAIGDVAVDASARDWTPVAIARSAFDASALEEGDTDFGGRLCRVDLRLRFARRVAWMVGHHALGARSHATHLEGPGCVGDGTLTVSRVEGVQARSSYANRRGADGRAGAVGDDAPHDSSGPQPD